MCLTQELCRAQQRARKGPTPLSACALLLDKLLPPDTPTQQPDIKSETGQRYNYKISLLPNFKALFIMIFGASVLFLSVTAIINKYSTNKLFVCIVLD